MFSQKNHSVASGPELPDVLIVISDIFCFWALDEEFFLDFDSLFLHDDKI